MTRGGRDLWERAYDVGRVLSGVLSDRGDVECSFVSRGLASAAHPSARAPWRSPRRYCARTRGLSCRNEFWHGGVVLQFWHRYCIPCLVWSSGLFADALFIVGRNACAVGCNGGRHRRCERGVLVCRQVFAGTLGGARSGGLR